MTKPSYTELLRDPRWQKKRLEIFDRDGWECLCCGDETSTLNVHHKLYGPYPWDIDSKYLITLCESCHKDESEAQQRMKYGLYKSFQLGGFSAQFMEMLADAIKPEHRLISPDKKIALIKEIVAAFSRSL